MITLGSKVKDTVTGFTGIATSRVEYLTGCVQYGITPPAKDNKTSDTQYYDEDRIKVITPKKPMKVSQAGGFHSDHPKR